MTRRFAQDTAVPVGQSQSEVKDRLRKAGADQIAIFESAEKTAIAFRLEARMYRVTLPVPAGAKDQSQEERRAWRLLLLLIKAKLEAVREGATTIEREFLADLLLHDGSTVGEWAREELAIAYERGVMPNHLMLEGPKS